MNIDYRDLSDEQIARLEDADVGSLASAIILIVKGIEKNILMQEEGLKQIHNIAVSLL